jgi:hypothetical protein
MRAADPLLTSGVQCNGATDYPVADRLIYSLTGSRTFPGWRRTACSLIG